MSVRHLDVIDLIAVAGHVTGRSTADVIAMIDVERAAAALEMARDLHRPDGSWPVADAAALLLYGLLRTEWMAGERTAVSVRAMVYFLNVNDVDLADEDPEEVAEMVRGLGAGSVSARRFAHWLSAKLVGFASVGEPPAYERSKRSRVSTFATEVAGEWRRVIWPSRAEVARVSSVLVAVVAVVTVFVLLLDLGAAAALLRLVQP
jgi:preprotein translocase SecE subunit